MMILTDSFFKEQAASLFPWPLRSAALQGPDVVTDPMMRSPYVVSSHVDAYCWCRWTRSAAKVVNTGQWTH